jgi:hypothetical protein
MLNRRSRLLFATSLSLLLILQGCTSLQAVEPLADRQKVVQEVKPGEVARVTMKSGETYTMTVTAVTATHVSGDGQQIALDQVTQLEVKKFSGAKTWLLLAYIAAQLAAFKSLLE